MEDVTTIHAKAHLITCAACTAGNYCGEGRALDVPSLPWMRDEAPLRAANELAIIAAATAYRNATDALRLHTAGRRDATTLPDITWRAERIRLTELVSKARIALLDIAGNP